MLHKIQQDFHDAILNDNISNYLCSNINEKNFHSHEVINIYKNTVLENLSNSLLVIFPILEKFIGNKCFKALAYNYIKHTPPTEGLLFYGSTFNEYINQISELNHFPFLPDLANFEFQKHQSYHAKKASVLTINELSNDITITDDAFLLTSYFDLKSLENFSNNNSKTCNTKPQKQTYNILIYRQNYDILSTYVTQSEYLFVKAIKEYSNIDKAFNFLINKGLSQKQLSELLLSIINKGIVKNI